MSQSKKLMTPPSVVDGMEYVDDHAALSTLDQNGVAFSVTTANISDADIKGSIAKNNRLHRKYDKERAEDIARQFKASGLCLRLVAIWIVVTELGSKPRRMLDVLGGNHRLGALVINGARRVQFYIVDSDDELLIRRLRNNLNNMTGLGNDRQTMLANAHTEYLFRGGSALTSEVVIEIAEVYHLKTSALKAYISVESVKQVIEGHNFKLKRLKSQHFKLLGQLRGNHKVMVEAAKAANTANMSTEATRDMVRLVRAERGGEAAQLVALRKAVVEYNQYKVSVGSEGKRTAIKLHTSYDDLMSNLRRLVNFFERIKPTRPSHVDNTSAERDAEIRKMFTKVDGYRRKILRKKN